MHPILFRIPLPGWNLPWLGRLTNLPIYSYGVMLGLSMVVGWYLTLGLVEKDGLPKEDMANCYVFTALMALLGSRLLYIATNPQEFQTLSDWFALRRGGLVAYGGFLGGFVGSYLFLKRKKLPLLPWADAVVPSLALGLMLTRIGCYLFGCDFGKPLHESAPGVLKRLGTFPHWPEGTLERGTGSPAWFQHYERHLVGLDSAASLPVHPTQLYEALVGLGLFGLLLFQRKHQKFRGQLFLLFTFAYGFLRYCLEMVRDDAERGEYGPQFAEHLLVPGGLLLLGITYGFTISKAIENRELRLITRAIALLPAVVLYLVMRPPSFADQTLVKLSTSQWVALLTGLAAAIAYGVFWNAAEAHPEQAMALGLEPSTEESQEPFSDSKTAQAPLSNRPKRKKKRSVAVASVPAEQYASGAEAIAKEPLAETTAKPELTTGETKEPSGEQGTAPGGSDLTNPEGTTA